MIQSPAHCKKPDSKLKFTKKRSWKLDLAASTYQSANQSASSRNENPDLAFFSLGGANRNVLQHDTPFARAVIGLLVLMLLPTGLVSV